MKKEFAAVNARLARLLSRFRRVRIAVLGDLMLDRYLWGHAHRLSPEAAVPVVDFVSQNDCLGGAANVAANLAALGAQVQQFGVIGGKKTPSKKIADDEPGSALRAHLQKRGVVDAGVLADFRRITTVKTRIIARHHHIVRIDQERRDPLAPETEEQLFHLLLGSLKKLDAVVLSDYDKGLITDAFADRVLHACHQFKIPVFAKPRKLRPAPYTGARVVVCNRDEASSCLNRPISDDKSIEEAVSALLTYFACEAVVITRHEEGMSVFEEGSPRTFHIPATSFERTYAQVGQPGASRSPTGRQVFDVTGAGDTVLAVLSLASAAGATLRDAAVLANIAAGVVVGKLGTATVAPAELLSTLQEVPT